MFLSAKTEYACIALLELALRHGEPRPIPLSEVSARHHLKSAFLVQILLQLKEAGLVSSTRGASGGYRLAKPPDAISLWDVFAKLDRQEAATDREITPSALTEALQEVWKRVAEAREEILRDTTLADLLPDGCRVDYVI